VDLSNIEDYDALLLTILLMGRYEGATSGPADFEFAEQFKQLRTWRHHEGSKAVLKLWSDRSNQGAPTFIIKHTRKGLIRFSFLRSYSIPDWMVDGTRFDEQDLDLQYDRIEINLVSLRYATARLEEDSNRETATINKLSKESQEVDRALQDWVSHVPKKHSYKWHSIQEEHFTWPKPHFYCPTIYSFSNLRYAAVWLRYFSAQMLIDSTHLRILECRQGRPSDIQHHENQKQKQAILTNLNIMAQHLASSIPFTIGRYKLENGKAASGIERQISIIEDEREKIKPYLGYILVWPLSVAAGLKGVDAKLQMWFRAELAGLGKILGDGVIESAESKHWVTF
jgi:hypothetical protein